MDIIRYEDTDKSWDRVVERHEGATVAHLSAWGRIIERAYGHESVPLAAIEGDDVVGVLPLVRMKSRLFGHRLVSMPFLDYGGIASEAGRGIEAALLDAALARARTTGAQSLACASSTPWTSPRPCPTIASPCCCRSRARRRCGRPCPRSGATACARERRTGSWRRGAASRRSTSSIVSSP